MSDRLAGKVALITGGTSGTAQQQRNRLPLKAHRGH